MVFSVALGVVLGSTLVAEKAPELDLKDTKGNVWTIAKLTKDKVYLVEFWATWCSTCKKIAPVIEEFVKTNRGDKLEYLSVSIDTDKSALIAYLKAKKPEWPVLLDPEFNAAERWKAMEVPRFAVVKNGNLVWVKTGEVKKQELESAYQAALGDSRG